MGMTTKQNEALGKQASAFDVAKLIAAGLAGQRSTYYDLMNWSGREYEAIMRAAEELAPLYNAGMMPRELTARLGRSMSA